MSSPICIYGVPMDLGQKRRGVDMGPSAIRYADLQKRLRALGLQVRDGGNFAVPVVEEVPENHSGLNAHNVSAIVQVCQDCHQAMRRSIEADERIIVLGGDHSIALGTVSAALYRSEKAGVIWVDAHGDFNTPVISPSGNVHGMVVAALMGRCPPPLMIGERRLQPEQLVMIATRDLDSSEKVAIREGGIKVVSMRDVDEMGIAGAITEARQSLKDMDTIHISFDMDALDPHVAPGVGTPVSGGLTVREAHLLMETLSDDGRVRSLDLVEVNPILDDRNQTAKVAVDLACSLFGQRII